jgi:hypothetical protein
MIERVLGRVLASAALTIFAVAGSAHSQTALVKPEDVGMSSAKLARLHDALKLHIDAGQIPGGIVLVAREGKLVHFEAQGMSRR